MVQYVYFTNPVTLYPFIYNHRDSVTSTPFQSLEYVYILLYILFLHLFHTFSSQIFPCWQLTIKLHCYHRFCLSPAFLLFPTYFSHSLPWRWRQQNSQKCLSSMVSYLPKNNSPHRKLLRNGNRYNQDVQFAITCLLTNFGEVQFSQLNKASAMCSNNTTSKAESAMHVSCFRKLITSSQAKY